MEGRVSYYSHLFNWDTCLQVSVFTPVHYLCDIESCVVTINIWQGYPHYFFSKSWEFHCPNKSGSGAYKPPYRNLKGCGLEGLEFRLTVWGGHSFLGYCFSLGSQTGLYSTSEERRRKIKFDTKISNRSWSLLKKNVEYKIRYCRCRYGMLLWLPFYVQLQ